MRRQRATSTTQGERPVEREAASSVTTASQRQWLWHGLAGDLIFFGILAFGCLLFVAASTATHYGLASTAARVKHELDTLPFAEAQPPGTRVKISGTISKSTKPLHKNFVAYVEEIYRGPSKRHGDDWKVIGGERQTFSIDTPQGGKHLADPDYDLAPRIGWSNNPLLAEWDHAGAQELARSGRLKGAKRIRGLVPGGPVTAVGTITDRGEFDAEYVVGAALDDVEKQLAPIASGQTSRTGYWMTAIGLTGLAVTIAMFVRTRMKRVPAPARR
jgi:hypothetical protein